MGTIYEKLVEICAEHELDVADFTTCMILNNWHNQGENLEEALKKTQEAKKEYQKPLILEDDYCVREVVVKLVWDKVYSQKMLDFYQNTVLPESIQKSSLKKKLRSWLYQFQIYSLGITDNSFE